MVALDIDGTLADYHGSFQKFCITYFNMEDTFPYRNEMGAPLPWDGTGEFEDFLCLSKSQYREAKLAYRQGGNKRWLPAYPGAAAMVSDLRSIGAEVWIATTRPWQRLDNIDPDTREWMRRNGIEVDGMLYGDDKYDQLVDHLDHGRVVGVIDDLPVQFETAQKLGLPVMLRENYHNAATGENCVPRGSLSMCGQWLRKQVLDFLERQQ